MKIAPRPDAPPDAAAPILRPGLFRGLSWRLLGLTVVFVLVAEVLIFLPSVARFRLAELDDRLNAALLALTAVEAHPSGQVDHEVQLRLLAQAGVLAMEARPVFSTGWETHRILGPDRPAAADALHDITTRPWVGSLSEALAALVRTEDRRIVVRGRPSADPSMIVEVMIEEAPVIAAMRGYGWRILWVSLFLCAVTAGLLYLALHRLLVRPLLGLSASMQAFREAPQDPARILVPSGRTDEVGLAERELAALQTRLREALDQQGRLAAVGTAVAKISHDLKGILTTAVLESDRLEKTAGGDPEVRAVTRDMAAALDRAIAMTSATLRFAKQGPPAPTMAPVPLRPVVEAAGRVADGAVVVAVPAGLAVLGDGDLLLRALENLVRNAAQAGARRVEVAAQARPYPGDVVLRVIDNGPGLAPRARANLFVPFSGSARSEGTGLGLPIARDLLRAMGGDLDLERSDGSGTVFRAVLKAAPGGVA